MRRRRSRPRSWALASGCALVALVGCGEPGAQVDAGGDAAIDATAADALDAALDAAPGPFAQRAYVKASNTAARDHFGHAVAISADGSTMAVGAPFEDSAATGIGGSQADDSAMDAGAVYVFVRSGTSWTQQAYVKASNTGAGDWFGASVALSADGGTLVVGAPFEDSAATGVGGSQGDDAVRAGAVYVFVRSGAVWAQHAYVKASNTGGGDRFGGAVALSAAGSVLAVAAGGEASAATGVDGDQADDSAMDAGAVYVFVRTGTSWRQQAYVKASNTDAGDGFGGRLIATRRWLALDADGATLAVGAGDEASGFVGMESDDSRPGAGAVYVFARSGAAWTQEAYLKAATPGGGANFGTVGLSADGSTLAVGAELGDSSAGNVSVFVRTGATWALREVLTASHPSTASHFGSAVALTADGARLAIAAVTENGLSMGIDGDPTPVPGALAGAAYLFVRSGGTFTQAHYVKASNTDRSDMFGTGIAQANDGTIVVGAAGYGFLGDTDLGEASAATGIDGDEADDSRPGAGAVYVFR